MKDSYHWSSFISERNYVKFIQKSWNSIEFNQGWKIFKQA